VVTNGPTALQQGTIAGLGLGDVFDAILISEAEGVRKPDPSIFRRAAMRIGREPRAAVFVGDNPDADVAGAQNAGMRAVWFRSRAYSPPPTPDAAIDRLSELPAAIAAWGAAAFAGTAPARTVRTTPAGKIAKD
jgi:putative hydrolase of the HAD superfamily